MHVQVGGNSTVSSKVSLFTKKQWLELELDYLYFKRSQPEVVYNLFKTLTIKLDKNKNEHEKLSTFQWNMSLAIDGQYRKKVA